MKLSIWQQWSSNHSADFTLVGSFESAEQAKQAAAKLKAILTRIAEYYANLTPEEFMEHTEDYERPLSPVEQRIWAEYDLDWPYAPDWLYDETTLSKQVQVFDRFVFVTHSPAQTGSGYRPFDTILQRLGGTVLLDGGNIETGQMTRIESNIRFRLPSTDEIEQIIRGFRRYGYIPNINDDRIGSITMASTVVSMLATLLSYLRKSGCTDIQITLVEKEDSGTWG
jgi:hypothetical protein